MNYLFHQNSSERISLLMEVTAKMETDVVALSYQLGIIIKYIVNSNHTHTSTFYQVSLFYYVWRIEWNEYYFQDILVIGSSILESSIQDLV